MLCVFLVGVCSWGKHGLVKTFTAWQKLASMEDTGKPGKYWQAWKILASLENTGSGVGGGAVLGDILPEK